MEKTALELFSLLDNIDTLSDVCKNDDALFRKLALREAAKRFDYADTDGHKVTFKEQCACKTGIKSIDEPASECTYKPTYVYSYTDTKGNIIVVREVLAGDE